MLKKGKIKNTLNTKDSMHQNNGKQKYLYFKQKYQLVFIS